MKKQQQQTLPSQFFPRVAEVFVLELTEVTFGCIAHAWKTEIMQIYSWKHSACVKDMKQNKFLWSFCKAASWIDQNRGAICKNALCTLENMAKSIDRAPAKPSPAKRRHFQTFKKVHHKTVDEKGDTCVNSEVRSSVVKWMNWQTVKCYWQTAFSAAGNW